MLTDVEIENPIKRVGAYTAETSLTDFLPRLHPKELNELKIDLTAHIDKNKLTLDGMFPKKMGVNVPDNQTTCISKYTPMLTLGAVYD